MLESRSFNGQRFVLAIVAVFIFVYLYEWVLHGWFLADLYRQTAGLWRSPAAVQDHMIWMLAGFLVFVVFFAAIYLRFRRNGRLGEGAYYGLLIGLLLCAVNLVTYAVQPLPLLLVIYWCLGSVVEGMFAGILMAVVYKDRELFV